MKPQSIEASIPGEEHLGKALFLVMRACMFSPTPLPELESLPLAQLRLLMAVFYSPHTPMKEFSEYMKISQSTLTQLADKLVRKGYIERETDPNDRRVIRLVCSLEGTDLIIRDKAQTNEVLAEIWNNQTELEQQETMSFLARLAELGVQARAKLGHPLTVLPTNHPLAEQSESIVNRDTPETVFNLMQRRIRGQAQPS